jgi:hypothetical protein
MRTFQKSGNGTTRDEGTHMNTRQDTQKVPETVEFGIR